MRVCVVNCGTKLKGKAIQAERDANLEGTRCVGLDFFRKWNLLTAAICTYE